MLSPVPLFASLILPLRPGSSSSEVGSPTSIAFIANRTIPSIFVCRITPLLKPGQKPEDSAAIARTSIYSWSCFHENDRHSNSVVENSLSRRAARYKNCRVKHDLMGRTLRRTLSLLQNHPLWISVAAASRDPLPSPRALSHCRAKSAGCDTPGISTSRDGHAPRGHRHGAQRCD
jgi:hypothetical protein